jgi:hypothetical protein
MNLAVICTHQTAVSAHCGTKRMSGEETAVWMGAGEELAAYAGQSAALSPRLQLAALGLSMPWLRVYSNTSAF